MVHRQGMEQQPFRNRKVDCGVSDFKTIGEVAGKGWSDDLSNYTYVDNTLPNGKAIAYYKLDRLILMASLPTAKLSLCSTGDQQHKSHMAGLSQSGQGKSGYEIVGLQCILW